MQGLFKTNKHKQPCQYEQAVSVGAVVGAL